MGVRGGCPVRPILALFVIGFGDGCHPQKVVLNKVSHFARLQKKDDPDGEQFHVQAMGSNFF